MKIKEKKVRKKNPFFEHEGKCPSCGEMVKLTAVKRIEIPGTPAKVAVDVKMEKPVTLNDFGKEGKKHDQAGD